MIIRSARPLRYVRPFSSTKYIRSVPEKRPENTSVEKTKEYIPKPTYQRVTYEYPPPPDKTPFIPVESTAFKKHLPILAGAAGILWALYAYKYFISDESKSKQSHLDPSEFVTFKLTYKQDITDDLALIEISPKYETFRKVLRQKGGLWNGKKLWSIEVKQPEIQVVRRYTPLPMYFMQYKDSDNERAALLRLLGSSEDEGRLVLLVKKYNDGEVSRYLHSLPTGSDVEIRGPFIEYRFPYAPLDGALPPRDPMEDVPSRMLAEYEFEPTETIPGPDNIAFFGAGTGIAPILQSMFSVNPPRGHVDVYYSVRDGKEVPFRRFLLFLEKTGRAKFHYFIDNKNQFISSPDDIPVPMEPNYKLNTGSNTHKNTDVELDRELRLKKVMDELRKERQLEEEEKNNNHNNENNNNDNNNNNNDKNDKNVGSDIINDRRESGETIGPRRKYKSILQQVADNKHKPIEGPALAIVCGPEGYVRYLSGNRGPKNDEPIGGLLASKNWTNENTFRMKN